MANFINCNKLSPTETVQAAGPFVVKLALSHASCSCENPDNPDIKGKEGKNRLNLILFTNTKRNVYTECSDKI